LTWSSSISVTYWIKIGKIQLFHGFKKKEPKHGVKRGKKYGSRHQEIGLAYRLLITHIQKLALKKTKNRKKNMNDIQTWNLFKNSE
jgi:hypothetical protein